MEEREKMKPWQEVNERNKNRTESEKVIQWTSNGHEIMRRVEGRRQLKVVYTNINGIHQHRRKQMYLRELVEN